ncbi:hypothetical protein ACFL6M_06320 [Candidatus Eisenbacteria bacterium]|uniref:Uncharacterized protein n=1 Tax=Eiseniibacteriota bacterium TaxID=2212470 RepID=A0ABV6YLJ4_UNCEI
MAIRMSDLCQLLLEEHDDTLGCLWSEVEFDTDYSRAPSPPTGWAGVAEGPRGTFLITADKLPLGKHVVYLFRPDQTGERATKGWELRFPLTLAALPNGSEQPESVLTCKALARVRDLRPLAQTYRRDENRWSARDLMCFLHRKLQDRMPEEVVAEGPPFQGDGEWSSKLLTRLDTGLLESGIEVLDLEISTSDWTEELRTTRDLLETETPPPLPERLKVAKTLYSLGIGHRTAGRQRNLHEAPQLELDEIRQIREKICTQLQGSREICSSWCQRGDVELAQVARKLVGELDLMILDLRNTLPETVPGKKPTLEAKRAWALKYAHAAEVVDGFVNDVGRAGDLGQGAPDCRRESLMELQRLLEACRKLRLRLSQGS